MELMVAVTANLEIMMEEGVEEMTEERTEEKEETEGRDRRRFAVVAGSAFEETGFVDDDVASGGGEQEQEQEQEEERRVDPLDGRVYTWQKLRAYYAGWYTETVIEAYWETECLPAPPAEEDDGGG